MPFASLTLQPGVNTEATPVALRAGYAQAMMSRFRSGFFEKLGGWVRYYAFALAGFPRALQAWLDLNENPWLAIGTTSVLNVIDDTGALTSITPQTKTTDFSPDFTTVSTSASVTVQDPNISNVTVNDTVEFRVPIAVGGLILSGAYPIITIIGTHQFTITAASPATGSVTNGGTVPVFTTTSGSSAVSVLLATHGLLVGSSIVFPLSTTVGGLTIQGTYQAISITDANNFVIAASNRASASTSASMNSGSAELTYYIAVGPGLSAGTSYSFSTYSSGPYSGTGASSSQQTGTPITATDYTLDNWNATLIACPANGGIYAWTPNSGFQNEQLIAAAPIYNSGIFVAAPRLALMAYGSTVTKDIGVAQDPLVYKISDIGDYNFWETNVPNPATGASSQAFESRIPTGNAIKAGMAAPNQLYLWTDLDLWTINYVNLPQIWDQQQAAANCGTVGRHAVGKMRGIIVWWGSNNFYGMKGGAVDIIPCTIWKAVFQNINRAHADRCHVVPVESANEFWFYWPSSSSTSGECDLLAKWNIVDNLWDGPHSNIARAAGIGQSVVGNPVMATPTGIIYQHEEGFDADGQPLIPIMTTGEFYLGEGEEFVFVDQWLPDFFYTTADASTPSANIQVTFLVKDYPNDTARTYGPYNIPVTTTKLDVRFRGRLCQIQMTSTDVGTYWRLGKSMFRIASSGRR
jgi:hypothetical protein